MTPWRQQYESPVLRVPPDLTLAWMNIAIALIYLLAPPLRTTAAAYAVAKMVAPIRLWGAAFMVVGIALLIAVWGANRIHPKLNIRASFVSQVLGSSLYVMWAIMLMLSAVEEPTANITGIPVYLFLAYRHSFRAVTSRRSGQR